MATGDVLTSITTTGSDTWTALSTTPAAVGDTVLVLAAHRTSAQTTTTPITIGTTDLPILHKEETEIADGNARRAIYLCGLVVTASEVTDWVTNENRILSIDWDGATTRVAAAWLIEGEFDESSLQVAVDDSGTGQANSLSPGPLTPGGADALALAGLVIRHGAPGVIGYTDTFADLLQDQSGSANENGLTAGGALRLASASISTTASWTESEESTAILAVIDQPGAGGGVEVQPPVAELTFVAPPPSVSGSANVEAAPPAAEFTFVAVAPALSAGALAQPPPAELTLEGVGTITTTDVDLGPPPAEFTIVAPAPTVTAGGTVEIQPPPAELTLAALPPEVAAGTLTGPPAAEFTFQVVAPTVTAGTAVTPPAAELALEAVPPTATAGGDVEIVAPVAELVLAAPAPTASADTDTQPPVAQFAVEAPAPLVTAGNVTVVQPPPADLVLAAPAPTVAAGVAVTVPVAQFTLAGLAPLVTTVKPTVPPGNLAVAPRADRIATAPRADRIAGG